MISFTGISECHSWFLRADTFEDFEFHTFSVGNLDTRKIDFQRMTTTHSGQYVKITLNYVGDILIYTCIHIRHYIYTVVKCHICFLYQSYVCSWGIVWGKKDGRRLTCLCVFMWDRNISISIARDFIQMLNFTIHIRNSFQHC